MDRKIKILIIEDEPLIAMHLKLKLVRKGFEVCEPAVGRPDALEIFNKDKPDLILSDIMLGNDESGIDVLFEIRKIVPDIPVIFLTGYEDESIKDRAEPLNPLGYFIKPVDIDVVSMTIENHFKDADPG